MDEGKWNGLCSEAAGERARYALTTDIQILLIVINLYSL